MEEEDAIAVEREELMVPPNNEGLPSLRKAKFLKPIFNPTNQSLPKLPFLCLPLYPNSNKLITGRVVFKVMQNPQKSWKIWVENLQKTHQNSWKKVGIFDAVRASTYSIKKDNDLIIGLAEKWCPETNTFIFPWGEATITLEDVMILGGFSVLGKSVKKIADDKEAQKKLTEACAKIKKDHGISQVGFKEWKDYFKGNDGEMQHVGFLVLWLSRYVFPSSNVFSIAVNLAKGTRIALAPAVLASIYRDLRLLKEKLVNCNDDDDVSKLVLWAPLKLVQVWAWERFISLGPKPISLVHGEPRLARWHGVIKLRTRSLRLEIESAGDEFLWRPYALYVRNWEFPKFYCDQEMWLMVNSEVDEDLLSFARCLRVCELVGMNYVEQYLPHRVAMQFGMDQHIPISVPRLNADTVLAWSSYVKPFHGSKLFLPPRLLEGDVTVEYSDWWKSQSSPPVAVPAVVFPRRKIVRKVKKLSDISFGSNKEENWKDVPLCSPSPCNEVAGLGSFGNSRESEIQSLPSYENNNTLEDIVIDLLLKPEVSNRNCETIAMEEDNGKETNNSDIHLGDDGKLSENTCSRSEDPFCSSSQQDEAKCHDLVGISSNVSNEKSPPCEGSASQNLGNEDTVTKALVMSVVESLKGLEDKENVEHDAMKVDEEKGFSEESKFTDEIHPSCDEAVRLNSSMTDQNMIENVPFCEAIPLHNQDCVPNETVNLSLINSVTGIEQDKEKLESNDDFVKDMVKEMNVGCLKTCEGTLGSKSAEEIHSANEKLPSHQGIQSVENNCDDNNQVGMVNKKDLLAELEEDIGQFKCNIMKEDKKIVVENTGEDSSYRNQDDGNGGLDGSEPLKGFQVNTLTIVIQDDQGEATKDNKAEKVKSSENKGSCEAIIAKSLDMDARISKLEAMISALQGAKFNSKGAKLKSKAT